MSEEVARATADVLAANAALESQLGQAHADLLLAQADAETLRAAVLAYFEPAPNDISSHRRRVQLIEMARTAHPGTPLADEVTAARAENAYLRKWLRDYIGIGDEEINEALAVDFAKARRREGRVKATK